MQASNPVHNMVQDCRDYIAQDRKNNGREAAYNTNYD
jgi:hypothetical protein